MSKIQISIANLHDVQKFLNNVEKRVPYAVEKSTNKVATQMKKELREETKKIYIIKNAKFNKSAKIKRATLGNMTATLKFSGRNSPLTHFKVRANRGNKAGLPAAAGQVKHATAMKRFEVSGLKAFVANFNGNRLMVSRQVGKPKTALKTFYSVSYPKMIKNEKVYDVVAPNLHNALESLVKSQLDRYLGY